MGPYGKGTTSGKYNLPSRRKTDVAAAGTERELTEKKVKTAFDFAENILYGPIAGRPRAFFLDIQRHTFYHNVFEEEVLRWGFVVFARTPD